MKKLVRVAALEIGLVAVVACLVSGPKEADPFLVELCLGICDRLVECVPTGLFDCQEDVLPECQADFALWRCPGGTTEQFDECLASIAVQPCDDALRFVPTEECDEVCAIQ